MLIALGSAAIAQEGFPLDGTWRGEWGTPDHIVHVVLVMKWNGETVTGRINPGPREIEFDHAALDPERWAVSIQATDPDGEAIVIEGTLADIGSYNRSIEGSWTQAGVTHPLSLSRE